MYAYRIGTYSYSEIIFKKWILIVYMYVCVLV